MPIYEYRCSECGHQQEHLQKVSDPLLTTCPNCGRETYRKQLTAAGFQLKGSGWYQTDFRGNGTGKKGDPAEAKAESDKPASGKPAAEAPAANSDSGAAKTETASKPDLGTAKPTPSASPPAS